MEDFDKETAGSNVLTKEGGGEDGTDRAGEGRRGGKAIRLLVAVLMV